MIKASVIATVAAIALAACANQSGMMPSSPSEAAPPAAANPVGQAAPITAKSAQNAADSTDADSTDAAASAATNQDAMQPLSLKTCATSPPQYQWIFKGACETFTLEPSGGNFSLGEYSDITVKGLIGKNSVKGSAKIALADAVYKNGDIKEYNGSPFPKYKANGTTYVYAAAVNQSTQTIRPVTQKGKPVLQYVITDSKGFGDANTCSAAVLNFPNGKPKWAALPATGQVKGKSVTINQYTAPKGFELPPKIPLYFGVNCYKQ
jgi:hypothetical protein